MRYIDMTDLLAKQANWGSPSELWRDPTLKRNFKDFFYKKCWSYIDTLVSGSPIIQDGKLIGAVTHVLVNDPTRGYGIFIENMLEAAE